MINTLSITNYKSIKSLKIKPKRLNVFIGEHNSGKSNILEALTWFSVNVLDQNTFPEIFRFKTATDFFYDNDASKPLEVKTNNMSLIVRYASNKHGALYHHLEGLIYQTKADFDPSTIPDFQDIRFPNSDTPVVKLSNYYAFRLQFDGKVELIDTDTPQNSVRTYQFKRPKNFQNDFSPFLSPPFGDNIPSLLVSNKRYKELVSDIFREKKFRLMLRPVEGDISMTKDTDNELYTYPYTAISETLQRIVFYTLAIETNKNAVLIFDEPESNTFPMYTKELAEMMARDKDNQYFIATHNPYLLSAVVSKTPVNELAVFVTEMKDYETTVTPLKEKQLSTLLDQGIDVFFNLHKLAHK